MHIHRFLKNSLKIYLDNSKSILLLGPRQTGKTTLIKNINHDLYINLFDPETRLSYEKDPTRLSNEIKALYKLKNKKLLVIVDEIQKIPQMTDAIQILIDDNVAQFIITGSSARKIKNLLPGRVILFNMQALLLSEINIAENDLNNFLIYGLLPEIYTTENKLIKNNILKSYVTLYLEEEIRKEAIVRNLSAFSNFLRIAAIESGNIINMGAISQDIGAASSTIAEYYKILQDCLLVYKIEALTDNPSRKKLSKSPKYLFFDLGVRRLAANEPSETNEKHLSFLFEQFVGIELYKKFTINNKPFRLLFWRDHAGPEVDYVIEYEGKYIPIEVKWTTNPNSKDTRHLKKFLNMYSNAEQGYIICRSSSPLLLEDNIMAISWLELDNLLLA